MVSESISSSLIWFCAGSNVIKFGISRLDGEVYNIIKVHAPCFSYQKDILPLCNFDTLQICRYNYSTSSINRMYYIRNRIGMRLYWQ